MMMTTDLVEVVGADKVRFNFHPGQTAAWESAARVVAVLAGSQGGKTVFGSPWLWREIVSRGPGDYLAVTPTFQLLELKMLPAFRHLFKQVLQLGKYVGSPTRRFEISAAGEMRLWGARQDTPTRVMFGYAADPDSLESATAKAAWLDEAGQKKFKLGSYHAVQRRLAIHQGRILITTTPYSLGWLKQRIWDRWKAGDKAIDVVRFDSTENPAFPREEFENARRQLPLWLFNLFYRAIFTKPAGLIYDCVDEQIHVVPRFAISERWTRYLGLDFGGVNTAGVFFAEEPETKKLYAYREYHAGSRTASEHRAALLVGEPGIPTAVGGSKSEGQWRDEFRAAGLPVREPAVSDVEVGIQRVYAAFRRGELYIFDDLEHTLDELRSYSRVTDDAGNVAEEIESKSEYHCLDAIRYIIGWAKPLHMEFEIGTSRGNVLSGSPHGVFSEGNPYE